MDARSTYERGHTTALRSGIWRWHQQPLRTNLINRYTCCWPVHASFHAWCYFSRLEVEAQFLLCQVKSWYDLNRSQRPRCSMFRRWTLNLFGVEIDPGSFRSNEVTDFADQGVVRETITLTYGKCKLKMQYKTRYGFMSAHVTHACVCVRIPLFDYVTERGVVLFQESHNFKGRNDDALGWQ